MLEKSPQPEQPSWQRWRDIEDRWDERIRLVATFILPGVSVLDLGAGAQGLREWVTGHYTPADLVPRTPDTLHFDMELGIYPQGRWNVAVMAGVLEYATDPGTVLKRVRPLAPVLILTYQVVSKPTLERERMGFQNHLSERTLKRLCRHAGFHPELIGQWRRQSLFRLT